MDSKYSVSLIPRAIEPLESRIAPAIAAPGLFTYTDGNGDEVSIHVSGTFTSIDITDAAQQDVLTAGGDIGSIIITGAGKDFLLTFSDSGSDGDNVVELGKISGPDGTPLPMIKGIATHEGEIPSTFNLTGYTGVGFAKSGGLNLKGGVTGGAADGGGLDVEVVSSTGFINIRDGVAANATIKIGDINGAVTVQGTIAGSIDTGAVKGSLLLGELEGKVTVQKGLSGRIVVGDTSVDENGDFVGLVEIKKSMTPTARVLASGSLNLEVDGNASGLIESNGNVAITVGKRLLNANVAAGDDLTLTVGDRVQKSGVIVQGDILPGSLVTKNVIASTLTGGLGLDLEIGGSVKKSTLSAGIDEGVLTVTGKVQSSKILTGRDLLMSVGKNVQNSEILPDGVLTLQINGNAVGGKISSKADAMEAGISGNVSRVTFLSADDARLEIGKRLTGGKIIVGTDARINVVGRISGSNFITGDDLLLSTDSNIAKSFLLPANGLELEAAGNISGSFLQTSDGDAFVTVGGALKTTTIDSGENLTLDASTKSIAKNVVMKATENIAVTAVANVGGRIAAGGSLSLVTDGVFSASVLAAGDFTLKAGSIGSSPLPTVPGAAREGVFVSGDLLVDVAGSFGNRPVEVAGNVTEFTVGGSFSSALKVSGTFNAGVSGDPVATLIGGTVKSAASIEVGGDFGGGESADKFVFGGPFLGRLSIGGKLRTDVDFEAGATSITIFGGVGGAPAGDAIAAIVVKGNLLSLRASGVFTSTGTGAGTFADGAGAIGGSLQVDGTLGPIQAV